LKKITAWLSYSHDTYHNYHVIVITLSCYHDNVIMIFDNVNMIHNNIFSWKLHALQTYHAVIVHITFFLLYSNKAVLGHILTTIYVIKGWYTLLGLHLNPDPDKNHSDPQHGGWKGSTNLWRGRRRISFLTTTIRSPPINCSPANKLHVVISITIFTCKI
jgi:hypothetical protein